MGEIRIDDGSLRIEVYNDRDEFVDGWTSSATLGKVTLIRVKDKGDGKVTSFKARIVGNPTPMNIDREQIPMGAAAP